MKRIRNSILQHRFIFKQVLHLYVRLWIGCRVVAFSLTFPNLSLALLLISAMSVIGHLVFKRKLAAPGART